MFNRSVMDALLYMLPVLLLLCSVQGQLRGYTQEEVGQLAMEEIASSENYRLLPPGGTTVRMSLALVHVNELNTAKGYIDIDAWLQFYWKDSRLAKLLKDLNDTIALPPGKQVWKPDIRLYNDYGGQTVINDDLKMVVYNDGSVTWVPTSRIVASCNIDRRQRFHEEQECKLKFGSWVYNGFLLNLTLQLPSDADLTDYRPNMEWSLLNATAKQHTKYYPCCPEPYPDVTFTIKLRRESGDYDEMVSRFIAPLVIIAVLVPFQFLIHPDAKERLTYCVALLAAVGVSLYIFRSSVDGNRTEWSNAVLQYIGVTVGVMLIELFLSVIHLLLYNRGGRYGKLPRILKKIFLSGLNSACCVGRFESQSAYVSGGDKGMEGVTSNHLESQVDHVIGILKRGEEADDRQASAEEWKQFVMVVDRICFVVFIVVFIIYTVYLLA